ncbi:MFS transporter, partial [Methylobacterium trifolii]
PARRTPRMGVALAWIVRRRAAYLPHLGAASAAVLMGQALSAWAPTFYVRAFGFTPAQTGFVLGLIVLCAAPLGHLAGGVVLDRLRRTRRRDAAPLMLGIGLLLAQPPAVTMTLAADLTVSLAGFFLLVTMLGFTSPPGLAGIQFLTPVALRGRVSALFLASVTLAAFGLGPFLVGLLSDTVFGENGLGRAMLALFSGAGLVGVLFAYRAARPKVRARHVAGGRISPRPPARPGG